MLKQELILTEAAWRATAPQTAPSLGHPTNGEPECSTQGGGGLTEIIPQEKRSSSTHRFSVWSSWRSSD